jgi:hypothetical protein
MSRKEHPELITKPTDYFIPVHQREQEDQASPPVIAPIKGGAVVGVIALVMVASTAWIVTSSTREQVVYQTQRAEAAEQQASSARGEAQIYQQRLQEIRQEVCK